MKIDSESEIDIGGIYRQFKMSLAKCKEILYDSFLHFEDIGYAHNIMSKYLFRPKECKDKCENKNWS